MEKFVFLFVIALTAASPIYNAGSNRIANGQAAAENMFPYVISLQQLSELEAHTRGHRCGGALITYQHVLTTASCTFNQNNGVFTPINPTEFRVFAGAVRLNNDASDDRHRTIANITVHPTFNMNQPHNNDIAIITLSSPFPEGVVTPMWMSSPADNAVTASEQCTVAGWGAQNRTATASIQLMFLQKAATDNTACAAAFNTPDNQFAVESNMVCAISGAVVPETPSGCAGDGGNPLECFRTNPNTPGRLVGLLTKSNDCTASANPEVYTRVSSHYSWVYQVINHVETTTPAPGAASNFQPGLAMLAIFAVMLLYR